jgi:hypothetical protein
MTCSLTSVWVVISRSKAAFWADVGRAPCKTRKAASALDGKSKGERVERVETEREREREREKKKKIR